MYLHDIPIPVTRLRGQKKRIVRVCKTRTYRQPRLDTDQAGSSIQNPPEWPMRVPPLGSHHWGRKSRPAGLPCPRR